MNENNSKTPDAASEATAADHSDQRPECDLGQTVDHPSANPPLQQFETLAFTSSVAGKPPFGMKGTVLGGYEVLSEIARGGMGIVYKARHRKLHRVVALKVTRTGQHTSADDALRFLGEAEAAAKLDHPHIVPIYEVGEEDGQHFFAMAFVEGASLAQTVAAGPLPPRRAAELIKQVAEAVAYAHSQGVVHRDLKPGNILLDATGQPRVTDFGLAKRTDADNSMTLAGQIVGTPSFMPPEQAEGKNEQVGPLADVYSLGATLYCLLTGRPPFQSANVVDTLKQVIEREPVAPHFLNPAVDRDLDTICLKCLEKKPERRYVSAAALAEDLQSHLDHRPIVARPIGQVERLVRWCRRNPLVATSLAGIAAIFLTAFVLVSWSYFRAEKARHVAEQREKAERWERYRANMTAASSAMQLHNVSAARDALDAAPEEHHNWEWHYFMHQLDTAQHVVRFSDNVQALCVSPDGTIAVVQCASGPARLWNLSTRQEIGTLSNSSPVTDHLWFSPDSKTLAYENGAKIILWDIAAGRERSVLGVPGKRTFDPQFSPNGTRLVCGFVDRTVRVWDTATGKPLLVLRGHEDQVVRTVFSPDGRRIVSAGDKDGAARVWDAETGHSLAILGGHEGPVGQAIFNLQEDRVLTVESYPTNSLRLWDAATGKLLEVMRGHTNGAEHVAFSPDGTRIASGGIDRTIHLWNGRTGQRIASRDGHRDRIASVGFSPDGKYLITSAEDQTARLWDATTATPLAVLHGHTGAISAARYTPDGRTIVTASVADGTIRLWDARLAERSGALRGHESFAYDVAFHPDGERVVSAAWDGTIRIWQATTGRPVTVLRYPYEPLSANSIVNSVAIHPDGNLVATTGRDKVIRLWDLTTEKEVFQLSQQGGGSRLSFSTHGDLLAAGGADNVVRVWDVNRRTEVAVLRGHSDSARDVKFGPDGSWLASGGQDRTIRIWGVVEQEQIQVLEGHTDLVFAVAVSRDGKWLASSSADGTVRLWDTNTWQEAAVLKHGTNVYGVAFTPDGTRLACACANNLIRLWDMTSFQLVAELEGHTDYVHQIAFSPDGTRLVSGSGDFTVRIWDTLSVRERAESKSTRDGHSKRHNPGRSE